MTHAFPASPSAFTDLLFGAYLLFPPLFRSVLLGLLFWLLVHPLLRDALSSGAFWHPMLMELSVFVLCVSAAFWLLSRG
ncbi:DUF1656 domain-containing protein [Pantoea sp. 1.19]|uniref:DUF1656 domain-containing protein n=1 Tax=Pantoea sp. 1.19 TaxID=1925589 RepID=UPI0009490ED5|nr:DUF1656 domain-containing protein [Pantoea sp. 1.19]